MIKIVLKDVLMSKNISLTQLSKATGISRQRLSNVANNSTPMLNIKNLNIIQNYLNVSVSDLITSDKDINDDNLYKMYQEIKRLNKNLENKGER